MNPRNSMAASATLHCLTGCAIGEIAGLMIGTALGLSTGVTIAIAVGLAFVFGYALSTLPLIQAGLGFFAALSLVFVADTLSIITMELVDNIVMTLIPGAMDSGLANPVFWIGMMIALIAAFAAAFPVNRYLMDKGKGHALTHQFHEGADHAHADAGHNARARRTPLTGRSLNTNALAAAVTGFLLGGLTVSIATELEDDEPTPPSHGSGSERTDDGR